VKTISLTLSNGAKINVEIASDYPPMRDIVKTILAGLTTDGINHKQWCLEQTLTLLGVDAGKLLKDLNEYGYDWEKSDKWEPGLFYENFEPTGVILP